MPKLRVKSGRRASSALTSASESGVTTAEAGAVGEGAPQIIQQRQRVVGVLGAGQQKDHGLVFRIARRRLGGGKHGERNALNPLHINKFFDRVAGTEGKRLKGHDGRET